MKSQAMCKSSEGFQVMAGAGKTVKQEMPLASDAAILALVQAFEARTLPYANWTHRAHLAVAVAYVRSMSHEEACARIRDCIHAYNQCCGDPAGYNETITRLFLMVLRHDLNRGAAAPTMHKELDRAAAAYGVNWLYGYYSKDRIWSAEAKAGWIEPDLKPIDFFED